MDARFALIVLTATACSRHSSPLPRPELVGTPLGDWRATPGEAFARNLWDLQAFEGRLYIGYGDAVVNTGPTDVIAFDPATGTFAHETTLPEEAITLYRVLDGTLFVPGVDAVHGDDGAIYRRVAGEWQAIALPQVVHAIDVARHGDELCVALQDRSSGGAVRCTRDDGATWSELSTGSWRAVSLFELGGDLYVASHGGVRRIHDGRTDPVSLAIPAEAIISRPTRCGDDVVFLARHVSYANDLPIVTEFGAFTMRSADRVVAIDIPGTAADVFVDGESCLVLANRPSADGRNEATIYRRSKDGAWRPLVSASTESLARSAELLGGFYYLGLGCKAGDCSSAAGTLVRVAAPH